MRMAATLIREYVIYRSLRRQKCKEISRKTDEEHYHDIPAEECVVGEEENVEVFAAASVKRCQEDGKAAECGAYAHSVPAKSGGVSVDSGKPQLAKQKAYFHLVTSSTASRSENTSAMSFQYPPKCIATQKRAHRPMARW